MKVVDVLWMPERIYTGEQPDGDLLALVLRDGNETTTVPLAHSDARRIAHGLLELVDRQEGEGGGGICEVFH